MSHTLRYLLIVCTLLLAVPSCFASSKQKDLVLAEDWKGLVSLLGQEEGAHPVDRLLLAHALLALNRSNEAICIFLAVRGEGELSLWDEWTTQLAERGYSTCVAHYLRGDALARKGEWEDALVEFGKGLTIKPNDALTLNARGQVLAHEGRFEEALLDLRLATETDSSFVDALSSLGSLAVASRFDPKWAMATFDKALELQPNSALAINGRGTALVGEGRLLDAQDEFNRAGEINNCVSVAGYNLIQVQRILAERNKSTAEVILAGAETGTSIQTSMLDLSSAADNNLDKLNSAYRTEQYLRAGEKTFADVRPILSSIVPTPQGKIATTVGMKIGEMGMRDAAQKAAGEYEALNVAESRRLFDAVMTNAQTNQIIRTNLAKRFGTETPSFNDFHSQFSRPAVGGIDMSYEHAEIDRGDWRVQNWYGLAYGLR